MVRDLPDYPQPGIIFRDIMPLLATPGALDELTAGLSDPWADAGIEQVVGMEARGFILGALVAQELGAGFVPLRKPGKLPPPVMSESYDLEYGTDQLEIPAGSVEGKRVLIVDDVLATGGTAAAASSLVARAGGSVAGFAMFIEIAVLDGRARLGNAPLHCLVSYE